jgi:hypothetical protein
MKWSHWNEEEIADIKLIIKTKGISDITSMDTCSHLFWWVEEISENVGEYDHYKNQIWKLWQCPTENGESRQVGRISI